ncbi:MAG: ABC transporter permease, partial [Hyphomicrobium sp.]
DFPDMTAEGSITLGAAVASAFIVQGIDPATSTIMALLAGALAGTITGILHTRFKINGLLAGILMMTALYSINLHVMGRSNIPLMGHSTLVLWANNAISWLFPNLQNIEISQTLIPLHDLTVLIFVFLIIFTFAVALFKFFGTNLGLAMRATGDNSQMVRAQGVNDGNMQILGLAISNSLIALSGALLAQYQGFVDVQMGIGMLVWGLASVIIGEALVGSRQLSHLIVGTILGAILFRLLVAVALRLGLDPNDLKLTTAIFVFISLVFPTILTKLKRFTLKGGA